VAAGEDQLEPLVADRRVVDHVLHRLGHIEQPRLLRERALAPDAIDGAIARRRRQPRGGAGRHAVARPALRRDRERLLRRFLGEVEVAEEADEGGEDAAPVLAEGLVDDG
jgi:hypothetical protein